MGRHLEHAEGEVLQLLRLIRDNALVRAHLETQAAQWSELESAASRIVTITPLVAGHEARDQVGVWEAGLVCGVAGLEAVQSCFARRIRDARQDLRTALADHIHQRRQILRTISSCSPENRQLEACEGL